MPYYNSFDICAAHHMFAMLWHGGQFSETYAKFGQLERLKFKPSPLWSAPKDLPENARLIYRDLVVKNCGLNRTGTHSH